MKVKVWLVVVAFGVYVGLIHAQEQQQQSSAPSGFQSSGIENQGIRNYLLGPGDVVDVRVFGQPELAANAPVDSDGNLTSLPFLETPIPAKCRTEKQVQRDIAAAYSKFINNPQVSVRITERNSRQPAVVFGAVRQPTRVDMKRRVRLNELMAASGGFTERAAGTIQILHTEPVMCPLPGEEADALPIDGTKIPLQIVEIKELRTGKLEANPFIRPGDYVLVTEADPVYITGSVVSPSAIYLRDQLMLSRALAMVGGTRKEAKNTAIKIYRQKVGSTEQEIITVDWSKIKKNELPDFRLQPFDVIEVPEANAFSAQRIGDTVLGAISGGMTSAISMGSTTLPTRILY